MFCLFCHRRGRGGGKGVDGMMRLCGETVLTNSSLPTTSNIGRRIISTMISRRVLLFGCGAESKFLYAPILTSLLHPAFPFESPH